MLDYSGTVDLLLRDQYIYLLIMIINLEILLDFLKKNCNEKEYGLSNHILLKGLLELILVLLFVVIFRICCIIFEKLSYSNMLTFFYIGNYGVSVVEKLSDMGIPVPEFIKKGINKIKEWTNNYKE